jgi:hypothetical protein
MQPMKNRPFIIAVLLILVVLFSCHYHPNSNDVAVSIAEDEDEYRFSARFDERKTQVIQNFMSRHFEGNSIFKGGNIDIDATTTFENDVPVYIKFRPGRLKIKFNKDENEEASCEHVKDMCEGIKDLLAQN